jgi:hypothetical protein
MTMSDHSADGAEKPLTPEQQKIVAKVRWLMLLSGLATMLGIAVVVGVVGYRMFRADATVPLAEASGPPPDMTVVLPKAAKVIATAVVDSHIMVTVDLGGATEVRTYDLRTLRPTGRLRFSNEP